MAATLDVNREARASREIAPEVVNGSTIYRGSFAALVGVSDATTASRGRVVAHSSTKNRIWAGLQQVKAVGDTSATPPIKARIAHEGGHSEYRLTVAGGLLGTVRDVGRLVWQTDDSTWTLTRAALAFPFGVITEQISTTEAYVRLLTPQDLAQFALSRSVLTTLVPMAGATHTKTGIPVPQHCSVDSVAGWVRSVLSGTATPIAVQVKINNGTSSIAIAGGAISVTTAKAVGTYLTATAVTGTNIAHEGETFEVLVTPSTTVSSTGEIELHLVLQARLGT